jgi:Flp pilus assembly protein TadD
MSSHLFVGEEHLRAGRLDEALQSFELAIESAPDDHRAIYYSALTHLKLSQETTALLQFNRALELSPDNANYISDLAVAKLRLGDNGGALRDLDRCVQLDPSNSYRYSLRAFARNSAGDVAGAIEDYRKAVDLDPEDSIAYNNLGLAEEMLGYNDRAQQNFATADRLAGIQTAPKDHTIRFDHKKTEVLEQMTVENDRPTTYLEVVKRIFTRKADRKEFLDFLGSMFKPSAK